MRERPTRGTNLPEGLPKFIVLQYLEDGCHSVVLNTNEELKKKRLIIPEIYDSGKGGVLSHRISRSFYQAHVVVSSGKLYFHFFFKTNNIFIYRSRALKSRGSYGNLAFFSLKVTVHKLRFLCTKKTQNVKSSY